MLFEGGIILYDEMAPMAKPNEYPAGAVMQLKHLSYNSWVLFANNFSVLHVCHK